MEDWFVNNSNGQIPFKAEQVSEQNLSDLGEMLGLLEYLMVIVV
jgi:hypothetical protein